MIGSQISGISTLSNANATIRNEKNKVGRTSALFHKSLCFFLCWQCVLAHA